MAKNTHKLAKLTEGEIKARVGDRSYQRGKNYYRNQAIQRPRIQGHTLKASCLGTNSYRLYVTLDGTGITEADCSCPVGDGGYCKHTAALLLTWLYDGDTFTQIEELKTNLQKRSKEELLIIIERFLERAPELEDILEIPIVTVATKEVEPVSVKFISEQVQKILHQGNYYDEYYDVSKIASDLETFVELGKQYLAAGSWSNPAVIAQTIIRTVWQQYEDLYDENGDIAVVVDQCVSLLEECLAKTDVIKDQEKREEIFDTLFDAWKFNIDFGGIDFGYESTNLLAKQTTPDEKRRYIKKVQSLLNQIASPNDWSSNWRRAAYGRLLLDLQDDLDDETYLQICRESGQYVEMAERLIKLKRYVELTSAAREFDDYTLLQIANLLKKHDNVQMGADLVWERLASSNDRRLNEWLKQYAAETGNWSQALKLAAEGFFIHPTIDVYIELKEIAQNAERGDETQQRVIDWLQKQEKFGLLVEIYLYENQPNEALQALEMYQGQRHNAYGFGGIPKQLKLRVAEAVAESHPHKALDVFLDMSLNLIKERGRDNYREAATYLKKIKRIYLDVLQEPSEWGTLIQEIRQENKTLRAMQEEFDRANL